MRVGDLARINFESYWRHGEICLVLKIFDRNRTVVDVLTEDNQIIAQNTRWLVLL